MSEAIKAGDLVVVTRSCCQENAVIGYVRAVLAVSIKNEAYCSRCGLRASGVMVYLGKLDHGRNWWVPPSWLKRIDPPKQHVDNPTREELPA